MSIDNEDIAGEDEVRFNVRVRIFFLCRVVFIVFAFGFVRAFVLVSCFFLFFNETVLGFGCVLFFVDGFKFSPEDINNNFIDENDVRDVDERNNNIKDVSKGDDDKSAFGPVTKNPAADWSCFSLCAKAWWYGRRNSPKRK